MIRHLVFASLALAQDAPASFPKLGQGWDRKTVYVMPGAIPGDKPGTYWFYYVGDHHGRNEFAAGPKSGIRNACGYGRFLVTVSK